jgi:hypothetical protein
MTAAEIFRLIGRRGVAQIGGVGVAVEVKDVKDRVFGRTCLLVAPLDGEGEVWVNADKVQLEEADGGTA